MNFSKDNNNNNSNSVDDNSNSNAEFSPIIFLEIKDLCKSHTLLGVAVPVFYLFFFTTIWTFSNR